MVHTMTQMAVPEKSGQAGINEGGFILRPVLRSLDKGGSFNVVGSVYWFYMVSHPNLIDINIFHL